MLQSIFLQFHFESCYWGRRRGWVGTESVFDRGVTPISHSFIFLRNHLHLFHDHHHHHHRHHHRGIHFCTAAVNVQESGRFNIFPVYCLSQEIRDRWRKWQKIQYSRKYVHDFVTIATPQTYKCINSKPRYKLKNMGLLTCKHGRRFKLLHSILASVPRCFCIRNINSEKTQDHWSKRFNIHKYVQTLLPCGGGSSYAKRVWQGVAPYIYVWHGTVWLSMQMYVMERFAMVWFGIVRYGLVWFGMVKPSSYIRRVKSVWLNLLSPSPQHMKKRGDEKETIMKIKKILNHLFPSRYVLETLSSNFPRCCSNLPMACVQLTDNH